MKVGSDRSSIGAPPHLVASTKPLHLRRTAMRPEPAPEVRLAELSRSLLDDFDDDYLFEKDYLAKLKERLTYPCCTDEHDEQPDAVDDSSSESESDDSLVVVGEGERRRRVAFSSVTIQTYSLTVGDHAISKSYPISLDWEHTEAETLGIKCFEELFSAAATKPQKKNEGIRRGFRFPPRMDAETRLNRLVMVTGRSHHYMYCLDAARRQEANCRLPTSCVSFDDEYDKLHALKNQITSDPAPRLAAQESTWEYEIMDTDLDCPYQRVEC